MSAGFKVWFAFCALLGLTVWGLVVWAVFRFLTHA